MGATAPGPRDTSGRARRPARGEGGGRTATGKPGVLRGEFYCSGTGHSPQEGGGHNAGDYCSSSGGKGINAGFSSAGAGGCRCRDRSGQLRVVRAAGFRTGLGDRRGERRAGIGDGDECWVSAGAGGDGLSEAAREGASRYDPGSERSGQKQSSEPGGEARREGPGEGAVGGSGSGSQSRGTAADRAGPGRAGAGSGRGRRERRGPWCLGGSPLVPVGKGPFKGGGQRSTRSSSATLTTSRV